MEPKTQSQRPTDIASAETHNNHRTHAPHDLTKSQRANVAMSAKPNALNHRDKMRYGPQTSKKPQTTAQPSTSTALMGVSGRWSGTSVEWTVSATPQPQTALTPAELKALEKKHESRNVNTARVVEVKALMQQGKTQLQIIHKLKGRKGMGERQIKKDMAALSKLTK
jgi:hypothetical protein